MKTKIVRNQLGEYRLLIKYWYNFGWLQAYYYNEGSGLETKLILTTRSHGPSGYTYFPVSCDYDKAKSHSISTILEILKKYGEGKEKRVKENSWTEIPEMTVEQGKEFEECLREIE